MLPNLDRYKKDLDALIAKGDQLYNAIQAECSLEGGFDRAVKKQLGDKAGRFLKTLPSFNVDYRSWYSEAKALIRQLLPDRLADFVRYSKSRNSARISGTKTTPSKTTFRG